MSDITIIDDLLDAEDNQTLLDIFTGADFPWYFNSKTTEPKYSYLNGPLVYEAPFFSHIFIGQNQTNSDFSDLVFPIVRRFKERTQSGDNNLNINRIKANLYTKSVREKSYNTPHVDDESNHTVLLYFVNDC